MNRKVVKPPARRLALSTVATAVLTLMAACNSGEDPVAIEEPPAVVMVAISGVVADGPLSGATVCYDLNDNENCDTGEPTSALTDADGNYRFEVNSTLAGKHAVLALVPATAIDKATGVAVGAPLTLKAPPTSTAVAQSVFVSALTTAVADRAKESGETVAQAAEHVRTTLSLIDSPLANFVASTTDAAKQAALAAQVLTSVLVEATRLSTAAGVPLASASQFARTMASSSLATVATTLAQNSAMPVADRIAQVVTAVKEDFNLTPATAQAVVAASATTTTVTSTPGPFVSVRRFAYTDANNYSYTVFTGDSSLKDTAGAFVAHEIRKTISSGTDQPYNRNQMYWTGTDWQVCNQQWQVSKTTPDATGTRQTGVYCNASRSDTANSLEDISGKALREVITRMRAFPLPDSVSSHTDANGLPIRWGPDPALLPAEATFPAGSLLNARRQQADIGGTDRIELTNKSTVRWADGVFRQATTLEQFSGMPGNLLVTSTSPGGGNTIFVNDLPLASQSDSTLEAAKRWRAGFDIASLKARFYECDLRKSDQASVNCAAAGDATLAISTQGNARLLRFASGYPVALSGKLKTQRFWAEHSGTVLRGARDLPNTRHDQRLNSVAWTALRTALNIPEHTAAVAPADAGPSSTLRGFTFTDASNYNWRLLSGDPSAVNTEGYYLVSDTREIRSGGQLTPFERNALYWTGTEWYDCPSDGVNVIVAKAMAPFDSSFCKAYLDTRHSSVTLTLDGRLMSDVVNDIRSYGSKDANFDYGSWGPNPSMFTALASARFPVGSTMEYRGSLRTATPIVMGTSESVNKVRVAPAFNTSAAFSTWPFAANLDELIAKYPGDYFGNSLNGNVAFYVHGITLAAAPAPEYTRTVEIRVAFDANGQKARFFKNNRSATTNFTTNYVQLLDTTYTVETIGGFRVLKFAALPDGFEQEYNFQRLFAERAGGVWYAWKDSTPSAPIYSIRMNGTAATALGQALGIR